MRDHESCCNNRPTLKKEKNSMNNTLHGAELVAQWRNGQGQGNPAGPLFAAGEFAQADIVHATAMATGCCLCTGSIQNTIHIECC
jgi:hypothetical protein